MAERPHPVEHPHPSSSVYLKVATVLAVVTAIEVAVYYVLESTPHLLAAALLALSATKFGLVAAFYMHLKFDSKLYTALFSGGLLVAGSIAIAFMALFGTLTQQPMH